MELILAAAAIPFSLVVFLAILIWIYRACHCCPSPAIASEPTEREHTQDGLACWCGPQYVVSCDECDPADPTLGCWKCGGRGVLRVTMAEAQVAASEDREVTVAHKPFLAVPED